MIAKVIVVIGLILGIYFFGVNNTNKSWELKVLKEREDARIALEIKQNDFNKKEADIAKEFETYKTLNPKIKYKEVIKYVTKTSDDSCVIPYGFWLLHETSIRAIAPTSRPESTDTPTKIKLSTVGEVISDNYNTCQTEMKKLESLQNIVKEFQSKQVKK